MTIKKLEAQIPLEFVNGTETRASRATVDIDYAEITITLRSSGIAEELREGIAVGLVQGLVLRTRLHPPAEPVVGPLDELQDQ